MGKIKNIINSEFVKKQGISILENITVALTRGDVFSIGKIITQIAKSPYFIRDDIFWQNFIEYLDNACENEEDLRKFSAILAEGDNAEENAKRIIKIIDDVGTKKKAVYISNLTRACIAELIDKSKFFKLSQCIVRLTEEDLDFLCDNVSGKIIKTDEEYIDDFRNCGLLKEVVDGFTYTKRAFELKKYALLYGHDVKIPKIPDRQMMTDFDFGEITSDEVDEIAQKYGMGSGK